MEANVEEYLEAVRKTPLGLIESYLTSVCTECDTHIPPCDPDGHVMAGSAVVVGCEGYWLIDPNVVGIEAPHWQDWREPVPYVADPQWSSYVQEFARWALGEALWFESDPNLDGVGGHEWESVEHLTVADIADAQARERWMRMCHEFVEKHKEHLAHIPADSAGQLFWQSKRGRWGFPNRSFRVDLRLPKQARRALHRDAGRWPVGRLFIRNDQIHFEM
ncbi:hypothetical protein [Streptomyces sp. NPDC057253]|uniref:hypothetical protein n=1 Tax=Streptomyces sp. NPDC057253 TaxID=3346069 RepID=UPI00363B1DCF